MEQEQVLTHFQSLNRTRIERLSELAPKRQRRFFDLLALLFHTNATILADPFSDEPPAGIVDYRPTNTQLDAAKKLKSSFKFRRKALSHYPIVGLYLINDNGLFNYPQQASYELWLVHISDLNDTQQQALENKLSVIRAWAKSLDITITSKLFSKDALNLHTLSAYDLDRFYLNGLVIAGAIPLWWLIPPNVDYDPALIDQQSLRKITTIDFGDLPKASAETLYNNTVELLDSSLQQGMEHLVPLLQQQRYLQLYPNLSWLSHDFKQSIYQDEIDPLQLDCMSLRLKQIEHSNTSFDLVELVQQSFYLHTNEHLSQKVSRPKLPWRRHFVTEYCSSWSWKKESFQKLDKRNRASFRQCFSEYQKTLPIFENISKTLITFAKQQQLTINEQHQLIDIKLQRMVNSAPDIIRCLPVGLLAKSNEEHLYLYRFEEGGDWKISDITLSSREQDPLYQDASLLRLLAWAVCNQILTSLTRVRVSDHFGDISISTVKPIIKQLLQSPLSSPISITNNDLLKAPDLNHILLFINLEQQPMAQFDKRGLKLASLQNNPLNYADRGQSLMMTIEGLVCSSWGEWHSISHSGPTSPLDMLTNLIHWWHPQHKLTTIKCWCPADTYGETISSCLEALYKDVNTHYQKKPHSGDYLLSIADTYYQLQWQIGLCSYSSLAKSSDVFSVLAKTRTSFSASKVDAPLDPSGLLSTLLTYQTKSQICLFLQTNDRSLSLYIIDEFGSLFQQEFTNLTESTLIANFHHFLVIVKDRNKLKNLRFFRLANRKKWLVSPLPLPNTLGKSNYLPVTVKMDNPRKNAPCTIKCGPKLFSGDANDPALFGQVAKLMLTLRNSKNRYPLYITELNFPQNVTVRTKDYITQKQRLENLLNEE
ncbi:MAG: class I adenylate cyclase [Piscirickettsiaceae bacterium]|nr:class I adenylate cyclase [Piscirickettsiaceae bacterium]